MDIVEKMATDIALAMDGGEWKDGKWHSKFHREAWFKAVKPYANEIERLQGIINDDRLEGAAEMTHRHCDPVTMDHIIDLRKRVALLEKQLENALSWVTPLRRENERLLEAVKQIGFGMVPLKEEGKPYREDR